MASAHGVPPESQLADLDAAGTIALCRSLADYGEAGGLSGGLMRRVGTYASARYPDNHEVLLAVARMYLRAGEAAQAHATLLVAAKLTPGEPQALRLLDEAQRQLGFEPAAPEPRRANLGDVDLPTMQGSLRPSTARRRDPRAGAVDARSLRGPSSSRYGADTWRGPAPSSRVPSSPRHAPASRRVAEAIAPAAAKRAARDAEPVPPPAPELDPISQQYMVTQPKLRADLGKHAAQQGNGLKLSLSPMPPAVSAPPPARGSSGSIRPPASRAKLLEPDDERRWLEPYELIGEIASGGMASVFLARLAGAGGFQRLVAIKRLHPHLAGEKQFVDMFLDEARLAAGIHHPHVVPILEVGESAAGYYLVMEFVEGDTLSGLCVRSLARGSPVPQRIAVRILVDALRGLHAAHEAKDGDGNPLGLVHRDCTQHNILIGVDGSARITDFGVARAAARLAFTRPQIVKGKVAYLSPEQAMAGKDLDRRSDVFTMGVVLWETLAGRPLFLADSEPATVTRLLHAPIPPIRKFVTDVHSSLDDVCKDALRRDRDERYPSAAAMADALEKAMWALPGGMASPSDVSECVEELIGAEIGAQRDAVRGWLVKSEPSRQAHADMRSGILTTIPGATSLPGAFRGGSPQRSMAAPGLPSDLMMPSLPPFPHTVIPPRALAVPVPALPAEVDAEVGPATAPQGGVEGALAADGKSSPHIEVAEGELEDLSGLRELEALADAHDDARIPPAPAAASLESMSREFAHRAPPLVTERTTDEAAPVSDPISSIAVTAPQAAPAARRKPSVLVGIALFVIVAGTSPGWLKAIRHVRATRQAVQAGQVRALAATVVPAATGTVPAAPVEGAAEEQPPLK